MAKGAGNVNRMELGVTSLFFWVMFYHPPRKLHRSIDRLVEYLRIWRYLIFLPRFLLLFFFHCFTAQSSITLKCLLPNQWKRYRGPHGVYRRLPSAQCPLAFDRWWPNTRQQHSVNARE